MCCGWGHPLPVFLQCQLPPGQACWMGQVCSGMHGLSERSRWRASNLAPISIWSDGLRKGWENVMCLPILLWRELLQIAASLSQIPRLVNLSHWCICVGSQRDLLLHWWPETWSPTVLQISYVHSHKPSKPDAMESCLIRADTRAGWARFLSI